MARDGLPDCEWSRLRRVAGPAFAGLAFLVGFAAFPFQVVGPDFTHLPGDLVDNRFNNFVLEYEYRWLTVRVHPFWHAPFCYPARWTIGRSDTHLGNLPIYSAIRASGAGPERAFQIWWLTTFALNFASAVWAARRLGVGWAGSAIGAYVFAFGLPVTASLPHAQLAPRFFVPPAVAFAWLALNRPTGRYPFAAAACLVAQFYCTVYIGYFLTMLLAAVGVSAVLCLGRSLPWRDLLGPPLRQRFAFIAMAVVMALLPLARPHLAAARDSLPTSPDTVILFTPKPADWVRPAAGSVAWAWLGRPAPVALPDFDLFPGGLAVVGLLGGVGSCIAGMASPRLRDRPSIRLAATMALAVVLVGGFVLRLDGWSPYRAMLELPGASGIRAPFRVVFVLLFPLGLTAGIAVGTLVTAVKQSRRRWAGAGVALLALAAAVIDNTNVTRSAGEGGYGRYSIADAITRREALTAAVRSAGKPTVFYVFPGRHLTETETLAVHVDAMWTSLDTGVPTVNGYTGHWPAGWFPFENYEGMFHWLRIRGFLTEKLLGGFVAFGEPFGCDERPAEREYRAKYPPRPLPPGLR